MFKREADEYYFDKKGKKQYYNGKQGKSYVWEFEEAINDFYIEGKDVIATKFVCQNEQNRNVIEKYITSYHIYSDGKIEKHVPKVLKDGYEKKYKYIYHDTSGKEHEICVAEWHTTKEKGVGQVYKSKPTHSKILSDKIVSEGNTSRRIKYQNGDIAEYGIHPKKGLIWLLYAAGKNDVELVKMPDSLSYKKGDVQIGYTFTSTERRFTGANSFAGL